MDLLQRMRVFVRVAQRARFAAAARDLGMSPAAVTKHVASLEAHVGARLLDRTTRTVALTEAGRVYLERCQECLQAFEDAEASMQTLSAEPAGVLRISAPVDLERHLPEVAARFMAANPRVAVDLRLSNRAVDLVEEGIDLGVRVAPALDGRYVARPLAVSQLLLAASPSYLRAHGRPERPADLARHRCAVFVEPRPLTELTLSRGRRDVKVALNAVITSNSGEVLRAVAVEGAGVVAAPSFLVAADLAAGRLVRVLEAWSVIPAMRVFAIYPHRRFLAPKVRLFVEALREALGDPTSDPWWPLPRAPSSR